MDFVKILMHGTHAGDLLSRVLTHAAGAVVKGPFTDLFNKMHVEGRTRLAEQFESAAKHLRGGECAAAAGVVADVIDGIKFDIPGL